jgi:multicomponent Na+:H+ antiporter subunit D
MTASLSPGLVLILGAAAVPLLRGRTRKGFVLLLPAAALAYALLLPHGAGAGIEFLDLPLEPLRVDRLSHVFAVIFLIAAFLCNLYALHDGPFEQAAALAYGGSAVAAVYAGDLVTLFAFWEMTAVSSVFLIWARGGERAYRAGMRYLVIQVGSGVILLAGVIQRYAATGALAFEHIGLDSPGGMLIFLAFGIKCAFPLLHNWLQDSYPEATVSGTVVLSVFTTKLAVYALARGYAGTEALVWIGATMTAFPIFYAVIENDLRRVLAYSLNNQLGFMVVGIGIGTEMGVNGAVAHAFAHILYKALLFMSMGAVLFRAGTIRATELGGLYKTMPWTASFCIIGAASISAFPLFSGFVTKSLIMTAAAGEGRWLAWLVLLFASAGVFHHSGIKIPFFAFFAHDSGKRVAEAPPQMLLAMGITAALCVGIGLWPEPLYRILPFPVDFQPYSAHHVIAQLQLLLFSALAFTFLMRTGVYPPEMRAVNLDADVVYRKWLPALSMRLVRVQARAAVALRRAVDTLLRRLAAHVMRVHGPDGVLARPLPTGTMVSVAVALLGVYLVLFFL